MVRQNPSATVEYPVTENTLYQRMRSSPDDTYTLLVQGDGSTFDRNVPFLAVQEWTHISRHTWVFTVLYSATFQKWLKKTALELGQSLTVSAVSGPMHGRTLNKPIWFYGPVAVERPVYRVATVAYDSGAVLGRLLDAVAV